MSDSTGRRRGARRTLIIAAIVVLGGGAIGSAVFVVARGTRRIAPVEVPHNLVPQAPDTALVRFRRGKRRQLAKLERRYRKFHDRDTVFTAEQDSLAGVIEPWFEKLRSDLAVLDTLPGGQDRVELAKDIKQDYADLKKAVYGFTRSFYGDAPPVDPDSLDAVLKDLISE